MNRTVVLLMLGLAYCVAYNSYRIFKYAQAENWTGIQIKSAVLTMICFAMLVFGIVLFCVLANQQEDVPDVWIIPVFFTWPLFISYSVALYRLLPRSLVEGWKTKYSDIRQQVLGQKIFSLRELSTPHESLFFRQDRQRGLPLAALSAAFGLCPSVIFGVALLLERPLPLAPIGYLSLFSTLQVFLLRSVKHTLTDSNESAVVWKHILTGLIGSVVFICVMLLVAGANL